MTEILLALLLALIGHWLCTEFEAWASPAADRLLRVGVRLLPAALRDRMISEWRAHLADTPLAHRKLLTSIAFIIGGMRIRLEHAVRTEPQEDDPVSIPVSAPAEIPAPAARRVTLTERQRQCLILAARGKSDSVIGQLIGLSPRTVNQHIEAAKRKYSVATRSQLIVCALFDSQIQFSDVVDR